MINRRQTQTTTDILSADMTDKIKSSLRDNYMLRSICNSEIVSMGDALNYIT
jgi:hypothetical protein